MRKSVAPRAKKSVPKKHDLEKIAKRAQRNSRRRVDHAAKSATRHARNFLTSRVEHLAAIRRAAVLWVAAAGALAIFGFLQIALAVQHFSREAPASGGAFTEGVVDKVATLNPLFATTDSENALSRLLYPGLLAYDDSGHLVGSLAKNWRTHDGRTWSVDLRDNVLWSDGKSLTADDVVFTVDAMKNPALGSPTLSSWSAISARKTGRFSLEFSLPQALSSFPSSLIFGVLPAHVLSGKNLTAIRDYAGANLSNLVSSGPFVFASHTELPGGQGEWAFAQNPRFYGGKVQLNSFSLHTFSDRASMIKALNSGAISAAAGLGPRDKTIAKISRAPLDSGVFAIFNTSSDAVRETDFRAALRLGLDRTAVTKASDANASPLETPIARGIFSSVDAMKQPETDQKSAKNQLDALGWKLNARTGWREKSGQRARLDVVTLAGADYQGAAKEIVREWRNLGIDAQLTEATSSEIQGSYLATRDYDVLIYELNLGSDPDQLAYWSKSGLGANGLNFANYTSARANLDLLAGRAQLKSAAREQRYADFVKQWQKNVPAIALYQPNFYYATRKNVNVALSNPLVSPAWRLGSAQNWTTKTANTNATP